MVRDMIKLGRFLHDMYDELHPATIAMMFAVWVIALNGIALFSGWKS